MEGQTDEDLVFLLAHDSDPFCRWEAGQRLLRGLLTSLYTAASESKAETPADLHAILNNLHLPAQVWLAFVILACASLFFWTRRQRWSANASTRMLLPAINSHGVLRPPQEPVLEDRLAAAGGVPDTLVEAIGAVLSSTELDGYFVAAAISLPAAAELIGSIPNIDPVLLHNVRCLFWPASRPRCAACTAAQPHALRTWPLARHARHV